MLISDINGGNRSAIGGVGDLAFDLEALAFRRRRPSGLPLGAVPVSKLESGRDRPASDLAEAERRAEQMLAARWLLALAVDSRVMSVA